MHNYTTYDHPLWKDFSKNLKIGKTCNKCNTQNNLIVHHKFYSHNNLYWDYPISNFEILCSSCHKKEHLLLKTLKFKFIPPTVKLNEFFYNLFRSIKSKKIDRKQSFSLYLEKYNSITIEELKQFWMVTGYFPLNILINLNLKISVDIYEAIIELTKKYYDKVDFTKYTFENNKVIKT